MTTFLQPLTPIERALHEIERHYREFGRLRDFIAAEVAKQNKSTPPPSSVELVDPRTGRPWRSRRKGGGGQ